MRRRLNDLYKWIKARLAFLIVLGVGILCVLFVFFGKPAENGSITFDGKNAKIDKATEDFIKEAKIIMADQARKALITINGKEESIDAPTVESIDAGRAQECPEGKDCGQGWYVPTNSPSAFKSATNGQCINTDGAYGSQCWDLGDLFWRNYAGRGLNTCGSGAAKGTIANGCWQKNAGNDFQMIWDAKKLQAGDWVIFKGGSWGHVGMALGGYNGGYVALYGTNQGGKSCAGGGRAANTINISLKDFSGAFRPKKYIATKPKTVPIEQKTSLKNNSKISKTFAVNEYIVKKGDTLGGISLKLGWWNGSKGLFGDNGYTQKLADFNKIQKRGLIYPNQVIHKAE